jgi:glycosyltransferase involved in cell wall biosynthesis
VLWYVHKRDSLELRIATAFCRFVATAVAATFPFATPKLRVLGHGVDDRFFTPHPAAAPASPLLVFVGRLAPIKGQATLIRALSRLDPKHHDARAVFVGAGDAGAYDQSLRDLSSGLGLGSRVSFVGPQEPRAVRDWYRCATIAVNLSPEGLFDKAALESMMCGTPTIVASPSFDELLGADGSWLRVTPPGDADALGRVIGRLLAMSEAARRELAEQIRQRTVAAHALEPMMDRLVQLMGMASHG